jgi:hypothetical protein
MYQQHEQHVEQHVEQQMMARHIHAIAQRRQAQRRERHSDQHEAADRSALGQSSTLHRKHRRDHRGQD